MKWAKQDPVSEKEINRNEAVYGIQNNRNPFIDYPGLEDYIWGDKKDVAFSYDNNTTGITTLSLDENQEPEAIYSIDGKQLKQMQRGLNIVKMKNGTVKKILKK